MLVSHGQLQECCTCKPRRLVGRVWPVQIHVLSLELGMANLLINVQLHVLILTHEL